MKYQFIQKVYVTVKPNRGSHAFAQTVNDSNIWPLCTTSWNPELKTKTKALHLFDREYIKQCYVFINNINTNIFIEN